MDSLGLEHEYVVSTPLPFTMTQAYSHRIPSLADVRSLEDTRTDYDACIYGGGKVDWGFGWGYFIRAFAENIATMAYGIALRTDHDVILYPLYRKFMEYFDRITARDMLTQDLLDSIGVNNQLAMCPAINLKEEKTACIPNAVVACPRYGDYNEKSEVDNTAQINWFVEQLKNQHREEIMLIPFYPKDLEGHLRDFGLCQEVNRQLGGGCQIFPCDGYNPRKVKYAISKSRLVLSGGRYHAVVWAISHDIPYKIFPDVNGIAKQKLFGLVRMHEKFGATRLMEMEHENKKAFEAMF